MNFYTIEDYYNMMKLYSINNESSEQAAIEYAARFPHPQPHRRTIERAGRLFREFETF